MCCRKIDVCVILLTLAPNPNIIEFQYTIDGKLDQETYTV